jgi:broad specificity phosphatase PhoE
VKRLFVIRHGQQLVAKMDSTDTVPSETINTLSEWGIVESEKAAIRLSKMLDRRACTVFTSPSLRCQRTAEIIAGHLNLVCHPDERLRDRSFNAAMIRSVGDLHRWQAQSWLVPYDSSSGESVAQHRARIMDFVAGLFGGDAKGDVIVVTHGTCIEHIFSIVMGSPLQAMEFAYPACDFSHGHVWIFEETANNVKTAVLQAINTIDFGHSGEQITDFALRRTAQSGGVHWGR